jgi:hypothetical protein
MTYQPACAVIRLLETMLCTDNGHADGMGTYMNPAPPVIIIFLTSGSGSYFVLPVKIGASFQTPKSSKNLFCPAFDVVGAAKLRVNSC